MRSWPGRAGGADDGSSATRVRIAPPPRPHRSAHGPTDRDSRPSVSGQDGGQPRRQAVQSGPECPGHPDGPHPHALPRPGGTRFRPREQSMFVDRSGRVVRASGWSEVCAAREAGYPERRTGKVPARFLRSIFAGSMPTVAKRPRFSRWRRLPPVFRTGEHRPIGTGNELDRIILYLPARLARPGRGPGREGGDPRDPGLLRPAAGPGHRGRAGPAEGRPGSRRGAGPLEGLQGDRRGPRLPGGMAGAIRSEVRGRRIPGSLPCPAGETITVNLILADGDVTSMATEQARGFRGIERDDGGRSARIDPASPATSRGSDRSRSASPDPPGL